MKPADPLHVATLFPVSGRRKRHPRNRFPARPVHLAVDNARVAYLEAFTAAMFVGRSSPEQMMQIAEAVRAGRRPTRRCVVIARAGCLGG